jgi:hypothetical protein
MPAGPRPSGRYGHTLNILGSKIYIFGGQVEGFFFNDLVAFDLNSLQSATSGWEVLIPNTKEGTVSSQGPSPPARTNHSIVTWNDKLYLYVSTGITTPDLLTYVLLDLVGLTASIGLMMSGLMIPEQTPGRNLTASDIFQLLGKDMQLHWLMTPCIFSADEPGMALTLAILPHFGFPHVDGICSKTWAFHHPLGQDTA